MPNLLNIQPIPPTLDVNQNKKRDFDPIQATFRGGAKEPFHRWYPYLEGYSPEFVETILRLYAPDAQSVIDPFAGTATTAFVASQRGLNAYICEVNPAMQFIFETKIKVRMLRENEREVVYEDLITLINGLNNKLKDSKQDMELLSRYKSVFGESEFFDKNALKKVSRFRTLIDEISTGEPLIARLLTVAVLASLIPASKLKRAGDVRYKTEKELSKGLPDLRKLVSQKLGEIAEDIKYGNGELESRPILICENAKAVGSIPPLKIDTLITSPPYVNGTNYFRNTKLELWFLRCLETKDDLSKYRYKAITAGINGVVANKVSDSKTKSVRHTVNQLSKNAYDSRIPLMVQSYFAEMTDVFKQLKKHLVKNAIVAIDIGDSMYGGVHVPADELLIDCLTEIGFSLEDKVKLRERHSKNGSKLKQVLLVFKHTGKIASRNKKAVSKNGWGANWQRFRKNLPHQQKPFSSRNWGSSLHSLCSYQGKLKPAIAHHLIDIFVPKGGSTLDPFAGVGTIPFEASLQNKKAFGFDISPTAYVISAAKLNVSNALDTDKVVNALKKHVDSYKLSKTELREVQEFGLNGRLVEYFHKDTLREIIAARKFFDMASKKDPSTLLAFASCLHILHGNRPYALSRRSHPITPYKPTGDFEYRPLIPRLKDKINRSLSADIGDEFLEGRMYLQDATMSWPQEVNNLDAVITSPPFFDSTRFYSANWMRLWFSGWTPTDFKQKPQSFIDEKQKKSFEIYEPIIRQSKERLKTNGVLVFHLGKSKKCDMANELEKIGKRWFDNSDLFIESVEHCESHGIRDKGTVTDHQYLVLY